MKRYKFIIVFLMIFTGCCKDEIIHSHTLSEFEKSLIPYNSYQDLNFVDEVGNMFIAKSQPREIMVNIEYAHPHGCDQEEIETIISTLNFESKELVIDIILKADFINEMKLLRDSNNHHPFILTCEETRFNQIQEHFEDITIHGFEFQNVLIFEHCSKNTQINKIIYSAINGVEFIEFDHGKWLKLVT